jgi:hypothetical protein
LWFPPPANVIGSVKPWEAIYKLLPLICYNFISTTLICKNHAKSNGCIFHDGDIKDIRLLNQLEERESHSKSHNKLCNCGVNNIIIMNYITQINAHCGDKRFESFDGMKG